MGDKQGHRVYLRGPGSGDKGRDVQFPEVRNAPGRCGHGGDGGGGRPAPRPYLPRDAFSGERSLYCGQQKGLSNPRHGGYSGNQNYAETRYRIFPGSVQNVYKRRAARTVMSKREKHMGEKLAKHKRQRTTNDVKISG